MQTARKIENEKRNVLQGSVGTGTREDETSTWLFWAAGFHHVRARSRLARILKILFL
jgi:hypothetical protein